MGRRPSDSSITLPLSYANRDPLEVVPSFVSMEAALYKLSSSISDKEVGAFWSARLAEWMHRFEAARERIGEHRFIDIDYRAVGREPLAQAERVLARMGIARNDRLDAALTEFLAGNQREQRPLHDYSLERFGLDEHEIHREFASYRERYIT